MSEARSLAPDNSGAFERAVSAANAARLGPLLGAVQLLRTLWDPWTCPAAQLPLLAWAFSLDIWDEAWPIERKRRVVAEARAFHRAKTTVRGYRMALGYVDAELVRAHLPRHGFVVARATTPAEHEAWLASLPEIRIYPFVPRIKRSKPGFVVGRRAIGAAADTVLSTQRAVLIRDGVTTDLVLSGIRHDARGRLLSEPERLVIPAPLVPGLKVGGPLARPVRDGASAARRVITLNLETSDDPFLPAAIAPSLTAVGVTPRRMFGPLPGGRGLAVGRCGIAARPIRRDRSEEAVYLSIRLVDADRAPAAGARGAALGRGRLQRLPFRAGLLVHMPIPPRRGFPLTSRVLRAGPERRIAQVEHALAVTAAARDTLFIDVNATRPITFGDLERLPEGTRFGLSVRT